VPPVGLADQLGMRLRGLTFARSPASLRHMTAVARDAPPRAQHALRVGFAYPGDPDAPGTWSGTPASLANAIRQLGATVVPLNAEPPRGVEWAAAHVLALLRLHRTRMPSLVERARVSRTIALYTGREMSALRTRALRRRVRQAVPLDAAVQIQTNYALPPGLRVATFEDMTVRQALTLPYPEWQNLSEREQAAAVARQARAYAQATACCFSTRWAADSAIDDYGVSAEKVHVVGVGRNHAPRPVPRSWDTPRFLYVGGDWIRKNGDAIVRTFARIRELIPEARLDLVGNHPRVDVEGVRGHGWLSLANDEDRRRVDSLFEQATCFVMPSLCEPAGLTYLEAGATGVPSIGSTVGGSGDLIGDGGCAVDPYDEQQLYSAMVRFSDGETARAAGARALERADYFTWPRVSERILTALGLLAASQGPQRISAGAGVVGPG
jgi:glycosyltransferase involved in cell wall biosynthesis